MYLKSMIPIYVSWIKAGRMTIEDVPVIYQEAVKIMLELWLDGGNIERWSNKRSIRQINHDWKHIEIISTGASWL